ncbi:MAG: DUF1080 domain-containing protein [Opitutus sp.]|nr:DUF1080 domain-containing protein [Opitutus sp.]
MKTFFPVSCSCERERVGARCSTRSRSQLLKSRMRRIFGTIGLLIVTRLGSTGMLCAADAGQVLFDGKSLKGWMQSDFEGEGAIKIENPFQGGPGVIVIEAGTTLSGITWTNGASLPRTNYEISLEAMRLKGSDFFCALTFPVGKSACSFVVGGWGGVVVGLSSVDHSDAADNETSQSREFVDHRWYRIRVRVTDEKIEAWIDAEPMVDLETKGRTISIRPGDIQRSLPLGIATYMTRAAVRDIRLRRL